MVKRLAILLCLLMLFTVGCGGGEENVNANKEEVNANQEVPQTKEGEIELNVKEIVKEYMSTSIKKIEINKHYGTDDPDDYIALIYLSFDAKNTVSTTKKMVEMYSSDLAAKLADEKKIYEIAIFWEVPCLKEGMNVVKFNLTRDGENMVFREKWFAPLFN